MTDLSQPAFPVTCDDGVQYFGMSLRDYFAAKALAGVLADPKCTAPSKTVATYAYEMADAMLAARATQGH